MTGPGAEDDCTGAEGGLGRRRFLQTLAAAGGMLAGGLSAWGQPAPPSGLQIRGGLAGALGRATSALRLRQPVLLQQLSRSGPRRLPVLPKPPVLGTPPLPSVRQRLLDALFTAPGTGLRAGDFGLTVNAAGNWGYSGPLTQVMSGNALAAAYAAGITLTPSGCQYPAGVPHPAAEPMSYGSFQSWMSPDTFGQRVTLMTVHYDFPGFFFSVALNTPGAPSTKLTYVFELSMEPFDAGFECFIGSMPSGAPYQSADVHFVPTNDGTQMALVELRGSGDVSGHAHTLAFRRGTGSVGMTNFHWVNVTVL